jgi:hypothetical protein
MNPKPETRNPKPLNAPPPASTVRGRGRGGGGERERIEREGEGERERGREGERERRAAQAAAHDTPVAFRARMIEGNRRLIHDRSAVVDLRIQGISLEMCQKWMFRVPWRGMEQTQAVNMNIKKQLSHGREGCPEFHRDP